MWYVVCSDPMADKNEFPVNDNGDVDDVDEPSTAPPRMPAMKLPSALCADADVATTPLSRRLESMTVPGDVQLGRCV